MTVVLRTCHLGVADGTAGACCVVDHDRGATELSAHGFCQIPGHAVCGAACGEGNHDRDGLAIGKFSGLGTKRGGNQQGNGKQFFHG